MLLICLGVIALFFIVIYHMLPDGGRKSKLWFVILSFALLGLYAALRAQDLQPDIPIYVSYYEKFSSYSLGDMINLYSNEEMKDPTYYLVSWLFSRLFADAQWWLAFVAALYIFAVGLLVYRESNGSFLSIVVFVTLAHFAFSLSALRQTIAMALTMFSYFFIKKKKIVPFVLLVLLAALFHGSALIFLVVYPIAHTRIGKFHAIAAIITAIGFFFEENQIRSFLLEFLEDTQYENYATRTEALSIAGFIIQLAIFAFCFVYYTDVIKKHNHAKVLYNLAFVGLLFQLFSSMIAEIFRISRYFSIYTILLIPMAISVERNRKLRMIEIVGVAVVMIGYLILTGVPEYRFFWQ